MILKLGSKDKLVEQVQKKVGVGVDGHFGPKTEAAVKAWQKANGLNPDGVVGPKTWDAMGLATTDASENVYTTENGLTFIV